MKIAYDISILGQGYLNPKAKTGIFRVVESILIELIQQTEIDLYGISLNQQSSYWDSLSALLYFQKESQKSENQNFFSHYRSYKSSRLRLNKLYHQAISIQQKLIQQSLEDKPYLYKIARVIQLAFEKFEQLDIRSSFPADTYDLYHSSYFPLPDTSILGNIPRILTIYDLIPILFSKFVTNTVQQRFIETLNSIDKNRDWFTAISEHSKQDFCEYTGIEKERVFVTYLAADKHFYPVSDVETIQTVTKKYNIPETPYFLSLCTLEPRKNLQLLIRCFAQIIKSNPSLDINLVLVGVSGWKNNDIFQEAAKNSLVKSKIIFTGFIPDEDLSPIYSGAIAFVYPSLYEGFGLPPLEAMQCGTPVITSNTSSLPEVVGDAGITINPKREDDLCQALLDIINDSNLRNKLAQMGIERAKLFSWKKCAKQTIEVYKIAAQK
jgi:glycosyltransferase involved in cell wall biosynthesis